MTELLASIVFKPDEKALQELQAMYAGLREAFALAESKATAFELKGCELPIQAKQLDTLIASLSELLRYEHAQYVYFDSYAVSKEDSKLSLIPTSQSRGYLLEKIRKMATELSEIASRNERYEPQLPLTLTFPRERSAELEQIAAFKVIDFDFLCTGVEVQVIDTTTSAILERKQILFGNEKEFGLEQGQFKMF